MRDMKHNLNGEEKMKEESIFNSVWITDDGFHIPGLEFWETAVILAGIIEEGIERDLKCAK